MPVQAPARTLWAPRAWLPGGWRERVLLEIDSKGCWGAITPDAPPPASGSGTPGVEVLPGPVLPGLVNAHSHAFQRAFAGMAERRDVVGANGANGVGGVPSADANPAAPDDFWSWRERMYAVALRVTAAQMRAIAAQLYVELLQGGYTQVCEFHYLHHLADGQPLSLEQGGPHAMCWALADAAADAGLGLTLMPALYERAGFKQPSLRQDQRRFASGVDDMVARATAISQAATHAVSNRPLLRAGWVVHSLRAAAPESLLRLKHQGEHFNGPIHIHVAEQQAEVNDCLASTGARPIQWLADQGLLDPRWHLVHATHSVPAEIEAVARSGAGVVLCPSTEANLGDGLADVPGWLAAGVPLSIGSDSHVTREWREELRWLEYGQRLARQRRNVSADPGTEPATAARLWRRVQQGAAAAAGEPAWGLVRGARADLLVPDPQCSATLGVPNTHWLDALVFSSPAKPWRDVMVAGRWVVQGGRHAQAGPIALAFARAMQELWGV
jgi:formimidoylglutamate deiminase